MENNIERKPTYLYVYFIKKLREKYPYATYLKPTEIIGILKNTFRNSIPRELQYPVLFQMTQEGLLKRVNHQRYKILKFDYQQFLDKLKVSEFWD